MKRQKINKLRPGIGPFKKQFTLLVELTQYTVKINVQNWLL